MMRFHKAILISALLSLSWTAVGQFQPTGSNPASVKWQQMETDNFKLLYPVGSDSLARVYGLALEKYRVPLSYTSGYLIGENYRTRMPVILHGHSALPNGSVTWAPRRIDMFTVQDPCAPTPIPWTTLLAIHEGRHAAQMQFGRAKGFKFFHYLYGEMFAGALAGIYPGRTLLEGDAVTTETALTRSGRGRQASFLNYLMPAFDSGDFRNYWKWSYGSQKYYAPDFYRAGYLLVSGTRVFFDDPLFMQRYFDRVTRKGWFGSLQKTVKTASGTSFRASFRQIEESFLTIWDENAARREPFMPSTQFTQSPWRHTEYSRGSLTGGEDLIAVKSGLSTPTCLIRIAPDGTEERIRSFSANTSCLHYDARHDRLYWTEIVPGVRWDLASRSIIRYIDLRSPRKIHNLTREGKRFNSVPSPDGELLSVTEYPVSGGSRLTILRARDGELEKTFIAPDSLQFVESAWLEDRNFVSGLSENGFGLYEIIGRDPDGKAKLRKWLGPQPVMIDDLGVEKDCLTFISDRTGVEELYFLDPDSGELRQMSSTRYGLQYPCFNTAGDTLFYSAVASSDQPETYRQGSMLYATAVADLPAKIVDFNDIYAWPVADSLSRQEAAFHAAPAEPVRFSEPRNYSKIRLPRFHSWAPVFFNYDNFNSLSGENYYEVGSLGVTGFFQNNLGTGYGFIGYSARKDPDDETRWRHSGHLKYTYTGLFPVFEVQVDFNERESFDYRRVHLKQEDLHAFYFAKALRGVPELDVKFSAYIPLNFSSGGLSKGLIPRLRYNYSNNRFIDGILMLYRDKDGKDIPELTTVEGGGKIAAFRSVDFSARGYILRSKAPSQVYPSLGFGAELGLKAYPEHLRSYPSIGYLYLYGYLPGIGWNQGIKLTAALQSGVIYPSGPNSGYWFERNVINTIPRGFVNSTLDTVTELCGAGRLKATFDYAIPLFPVDWSFLAPAAYIRNFVLTPFVDYSMMIWNAHTLLGLNPAMVSYSHLFSIGADFTANLGNFLWLPFKTSVGVRYACNLADTLPYLGVTKLKSHYLGFLFTVDM
ncbi:MAG: hypothetical protein ACOX5T_09685 [Candidatus Cryptobacteroides sp.]|jgi:hypothetical protein